MSFKPKKAEILNCYLISLILYLVASPQPNTWCYFHSLTSSLSRSTATATPQPYNFKTRLEPLNRARILSSYSSGYAAPNNLEAPLASPQQWDFELDCKTMKHTLYVSIIYEDYYMIWLYVIILYLVNYWCSKSLYVTCNYVTPCMFP